MKTNLYLILLLLTISPLTHADMACTNPRIAEAISCTVTKVIDGDTVHANCAGRDTKIRLTAIDSYESKRNTRAFKQAYEQKLTVEEVVVRGKKATTITKQELSGKQILVISPVKTKIDKYGRTLGEVYVDCVDVNQKLLLEHPDVFLKY